MRYDNKSNAELLDLFIENVNQLCAWYELDDLKREAGQRKRMMRMYFEELRIMLVEVYDRRAKRKEETKQAK